MTMVQLRSAVFKADEDNGDVETALRNLRQHVYGHMHTELRSGTTGVTSEAPIQLVHLYNRLVEAEKTRVSAVNATLQQKATETCEARYPNKLSGNRLTCVQQILEQEGVREKTIPKELYTFDFVSPPFSFDLAGWSLIATTGLGIWLLGRLVLHLFLRSFMRR